MAINDMFCFVKMYLCSASILILIFFQCIGQCYMNVALVI